MSDLPSHHAPRHPGLDPQVSIFAESDTDLLLGRHKLVVVGFTHRTASLAIRSRFAVARDDLPTLAREFRFLPGVGSCVLIATCNRLEAYLEIRSEAEAEAAFVDLVGGQDLEGRAILARSLLVHSDEAAVRHLFRVTAGLDAMVLGDAQILGQAKEAYRTACQHGTAGPLIHKAFHTAFRCAKKVRSQTDLGDGAQSVAGAAMSLLARRIGGLRGHDYLLVGANEMIEAAGRRLAQSGARRVWLCNRTCSRGSELAAEVGAEPVPWSERKAIVARVDVVVTCTGASEPIFSRADLQQIVRLRPERALTVVDIAVPPDVEVLTDDTSAPAIPTQPDSALHIIDLEDVGAFQGEMEERRCQAAASGEAIVNHSVAAFHAWLANQTLGPKLEQMREEADRILTRELDRLPRTMTAEEKERLATFGRTLIKRFLGAYQRTEGDT